MQTIVLFDIGSDKLRNRVEGVCRDHGLERAQFSAFLGELDAARRERLAGKLRNMVDAHATKEDEDDRKRALFIQVFPICATDFAEALSITRKATQAAQPNTLPEILIL